MLRFFAFSVIVTLVNSHSGTCPINEKWVDCKMGYCGPNECDQLGYPIACSSIIGHCDGGCVCADDYLRDSDNICIPQTECPSCGGDFNATSGDGHHCGNLCSNYFQDKSNFEECQKQYPQYNGCKCKKGRVFNDITGKCVNPKECPKPCNGDHYAEKQSCPSKLQPTCANPSSEGGNSGCNKNKCVCASGYILDKVDGKCIKTKDCPDNLGCNGDLNAIISDCEPCSQTCEQKINETQPTCTGICKMGCTCKWNYIKSESKNRCLLETECHT